MESGVQLVSWIFFLPILAYYENICEIKHHDTEKQKPCAKIQFLHKAGYFTESHCNDRRNVDRHFLKKVILPTDTQTDFSPAAQVFRRQLLAYIKSIFIF